MKARYVVRLFLTTFFVGGIAAVVTGMAVNRGEFAQYFADIAGKEIFLPVLWFFAVGLLFSAISQMGFFAYLFIHRFGLAIFKSARLWNAVQIVLIAFALFDLVYFRYAAFGEGESILPFVLPAAVIFFAGLVVAYLKAKSTHPGTFIPALFFMVVATIIEWIPAVQTNEPGWLHLMLYPLLICNAYQMLILHKYNEKSAGESLMGKEAAR